MKSKILLLAFLFSISCAMVSAQNPGEFISVNHKKVWVKTSGLEDRKFLQPLVILESGTGDHLEQFDKVFDQVAEFAPVLSYDRLGLGKSDSTDNPISESSRVEELRELLSAMKLVPPYIFVGNDLGAVFSRAFALAYPEEVVGLIYLDPVSPWENTKDLVAQLNQEGKDGDALLSDYKALQSKILANASSAQKEEVDFAMRILANENLTWELDPALQIPLVVMLGRNKDIRTIVNPISSDGKLLNEKLIENRINYFQELTSRQPNSTLLISSNSASYLPLQASTAVSLLVQQVVLSEPLKRIWSASRTLDPSDFGRFISELRTYIPSFLLSERDLNMIGYSLMRSDLYMHALVLFEDNLKNHPNSANAYDSYGDGLFAVGRVQESLEAFQMAVQLGEEENHRDLGLFIKNLKRSEEALSND
ncbi:MAG: alpha/beta fold hydrolase [Algoriphagus sp.]|uniref:alpha/beta hydrolase n=1 Tax=Algoriphagus sp. TaxID=1872435 RepID=UPI00260EAA9C|nr:alpha/beta hydrolase [Algoriphagus sp.]MDG1277628.1 alpha/beta fold hydrolase [Algoriphagus sp.]